MKVATEDLLAQLGVPKVSINLIVLAGLTKQIVRSRAFGPCVEATWKVVDQVRGVAQTGKTLVGEEKLLVFGPYVNPEYPAFIGRLWTHPDSGMQLAILLRPSEMGHSVIQYRLVPEVVCDTSCA